MATAAPTNRLEGAKPAPTAEKPGAGASAPAASAAAAPAPGGFKAFLPLIANLVLMPVLAYAMTAYVLVPRLAKKVHGAPAAEEAPAAHGSEEHGSGSSGATETTDAHGRTKISVPLSKKTLVNVSGTMGTRYLLAEFTLVGTNANFKAMVEKSDAELRDAAASALAAKTINDLEKPGMRNLIRSELITIFNSILGKGAVTEIYLTEFAIQ